MAAATGLQALAAVLLLLVAAVPQAAAAGLTDKPLVLPGRVRPQVAAAAAARPEPIERFGYFSPATNPARKLFYWFFQARSATTGAAINATTTPVIAWFNGGPGCSSLWGMFVEHGPYSLSTSRQLVPNSFTWATVGHMLYIDQPIGTGLSYSTKPGDATTSQLDVAQTVVAFLQAFYKSPTYSHLARNPFYLSGESFAGHYLPSIGAYMKHAAPAMRLSGVALGNPCTNAAAMYQSYPDWALAYRMIDNATHKAVVASLASCKLQAAVCGVLDRQACPEATRFCESRIWGALLGAPGSLLGSRNPYNIKSTAQDCGTADLYNCYRSLDARVEAYIAANKARLGAPASVDYQACASQPYQSLLHDMTVSYDDLVGALVDNGVPVMVFSGEDDWVCNSLASAQWLDGLIWSRQRRWKVAPVQAWAGGTFKRVGPLSFVRVANAGHMVPLDQPALSLLMLRQWIATGQPTVPNPTVKSSRRRQRL